MGLFCWALLGGLVGTVMMDVIDKIADKLKINWGGCGGSAAIGRWVLGILHGKVKPRIYTLLSFIGLYCNLCRDL